MRPALIIARKDMREALCSKTTYFYLLVLLALSLPYFDAARSTLSGLIKRGATVSDLQLASSSFASGAIYTLPLVFTMLVCGVFSAYAVVTDKAKRTLESLLATPLTLRQVWLGKSIAVALPSVGIALVVSLAVYVALNLVVFVPVTGSFVMPGVKPLVTSVLIVPVMTFFVVTIVTFLQLVLANPRLASMIFTVIFLGIFMSSMVRDIAAWDFLLIYLGVTIVLIVVTAFLSRFLTKEKVILSSKG